MLIGMAIPRALGQKTGEASVGLSGEASIQAYAPTVKYYFASSPKDPASTYLENVQVRDNDKLSDLENVKLTVYENTLTAGDTDNTRNHYTFLWDNDTGFEELGPDSANDSHIDVGQSSAADLSLQEDNFTFAIVLDNVAKPTGWDVFVEASDSHGYSDNLASSNKFSVNVRISYSWSTASISFSGAPGDTNVAASENPATATVTSNVNFDVSHKVSGAMENAQTSENIPVSNMYVENAVGDRLTLSTSYQDLYSNIKWGESVTRDSYFFLDFPSPLPPYEFTNQFYVEVAQH